MESLLPIAHKIDAFTRRVGRWASWLVLLMIGVGTWNVVGRYLGNLVGQNLSSNALIETQWYLFDLVFLLGAAYTLQRGGHVRVDVLYDRWSPRRKALADFLGTVVFLIPFCLLVIYFSWGAVAKSWAIWEMSPDPGGLPRYPIKAMILVSFGLLILQGIADAIKYWAVFTGQLAPEAVRSPALGETAAAPSDLDHSNPRDTLK